jgi:CheY-like chemotaxis protein
VDSINYFDLNTLLYPRPIYLTPLKIFVVEDDPVYQKRLKYIAELNPDHVVKFFSKGKDCIVSLSKNPAVVTLDYSLSDMTGDEVLKAIKTNNPETNVILVSS